jgi:hypothetical protein
VISFAVQLIGICYDLARLTFPAPRQVLITPAHLQTRISGTVIEPHKAKRAARGTAVLAVAVPAPSASGPSERRWPFRTAAWVPLGVVPPPDVRLAGAREGGSSDRANVARCAARRPARPFRAWWW